jgi:hypothetical protein
MIRILPLLVLPVVGFAVSPAAHSQTREEQALRNYLDVANQQVGLHDLAPGERHDVGVVDERVRARPLDRRRAEKRCYDAEMESLGKSPSLLARRSAAMKCGLRFEDAQR